MPDVGVKESLGSEVATSGVDGEQVRQGQEAEVYSYSGVSVTHKVCVCVTSYNIGNV